jgi:16S rRNA (cytosine967-C5)-methyltransferase
LVYAVCSFAQEEGPDVIADFLRQHPQFHREPLPAWLAGVVTVDGDLASHPLWHGADAFYAASLRRQPLDT